MSELKSLAEINPKHLLIPLLLLFSTVLLLVGLSMPVLTVKQMWFMKNTFSVLTGIQALWLEKSYILASILMIFSVIFPLIKLSALFCIWFIRLSDEKRRGILTWLEILGKWSMLDVFVVAVTIVAVKLGFLASAHPEAGIYYFAAAIAMSMVVTAWIDRLTHRQFNTGL